MDEAKTGHGHGSAAAPPAMAAAGASFNACPNALARCTADLVRTIGAKGTLRELKISMRIRFEIDDLVPLILLVAPTLHYLEVDLRPPRGVPNRVSLEDEMLLQKVVSTHCNALRSLSIRR
jgi:hypothetical protein